ncbi:MAG: hypothetical protein KC425_07490 [Anaerolineales bacterium]|nr:hypothetical protein [Anaerolineales bacterium]
MSLNAEALRAYRDRWQAVAEIERAEQRHTSIVQRWQQLNVLLRMAAALELAPAGNQADDLPAHQQWNQLRSRYLAVFGE